MQFFLGELLGVWSALLLLAALIVCSGAMFARALRFPGFQESPLLERAGIALLCGFAGLPIVLDLTGRFGPIVMTCAGTTTAIVGLPTLVRYAPRGPGPGWGWIIAAAAWIVVSTLLLVDWPIGPDGLAHSVLALDYVKHVATTWSIADTGTPPGDPAFFEPGRTAAYYYFYYTLTAVASILGAPLGILPRHVAYAGGVLAGFALFALVWQVWRRSNADQACCAPSPGRPAGPWIAALLLTAGLDIVPGIAIAALCQQPLLDSPVGAWTEQVAPWFSASLWVPHHVAALCAAFIGFLALARPAGGGDLRRVALAGLAFASMAGTSIYVALAAAAIAAVWLARLVWQGRRRDAGDLMLAGALASLLAAPWLVTLIGFGGGAPPIAFGLRGSAWFELWTEDHRAQTIARAITLLPFYLMQFGIFAVGAFAFWRKAGRRGLDGDVATLLAIGAAASLLIGTFVRSTALNNDLGWRVVMFAQLATLVWTLSAIRAGALGLDRLTGGARTILALGYCTVAFLVVQGRFFDMGDGPEARLANATLPDEIAGWNWLGGALPKGAVVQSKPGTDRSLSYGLYGRFPMAVADARNGILYGASSSNVRARIARLAPVFVDPSMTLDQVRAIASEYDISALVVTALDPNYADPRSWVATTQPSYANAHMRIFLTKDLQPAAALRGGFSPDNPS